MFVGINLYFAWLVSLLQAILTIKHTMLFIMCVCVCDGWWFFPDLGPCQWEAEAVSDGTHQHCARRGGQLPQPLPILVWRGQAGQVLGSGVQQGTMNGTNCCSEDL